MEADLYWTATRDAFARYLLTTGHSSETERTYLGSLVLFWRWCGGRECDPLRADTPALRAWLAERMAVVSPAQTYKDAATLKCFYKWQLEEGRRPDDPSFGLKVKRSKKAPTRPLSASEVHQVLAACDSERDRLIVLVLAYVGVRIAELAGMRVGDIDWYRGNLIIRGKGDKERLFPVPPDLLGRLRAHFGMFAQGPIWLSVRGNPLAAHQIRKIIYRLAERAKLEGVHPHRLRSTFGTEYMDQFGDIQALQYLMGHESIETTARYTYYTREKRARESMQQFKLGDRSSA